MKFLNSATFGLTAFVALAGSVASAEDSGAYLGGALGRSNATIDDKRIVTDLASSGFTSTSLDTDEHDISFKLFGGYHFNRYFALEGGYFDLGAFSFVAHALPAGTLSGQVKVKGVNVDLVGFIPFTEKFSAFGRVGANFAESKASFAATGLVNVLDPKHRERDTNLKFGVGLHYAFTRSFAMRVEAERYRINDAVGNTGDIDIFSIGAIFGFGGATPHSKPVETAPPTKMSDLMPPRPQPPDSD